MCGGLGDALWNVCGGCMRWMNVCECVYVGVGGWVTCGGVKGQSINLGCANCVLIVKYSTCLLSCFGLVGEHHALVLLVHVALHIELLCIV